MLREYRKRIAMLVLMFVLSQLLCFATSSGASTLVDLVCSASMLLSCVIAIVLFGLLIFRRGDLVFRLVVFVPVFSYVSFMYWWVFYVLRTLD